MVVVGMVHNRDRTCFWENPNRTYNYRSPVTATHKGLEVKLIIIFIYN